MIHMVSGTEATRSFEATLSSLSSTLLQLHYAIVANEALTRALHISMSWASLVVLSQQLTSTPGFNSSSIVLLHVVRGRPLFLRPSEVRVGASLACAVSCILST